MKINKLIAIITSLLITTAVISCGKKDSNSPKVEQISSDADKRILGNWFLFKIPVINDSTGLTIPNHYLTTVMKVENNELTFINSFDNNGIVYCTVQASTNNFKISKDTIELKQDLSAENTQGGFSCKNKVKSFNSKYALESDDILVLTNVESNDVIKINRVK
ncbi:hypothetical protein GCL60_06690 [Silvanigrella paludirubra]|uniref:Uncharacterized protein n=1 Tax=Silvanigrella paludirubra TaxID=2499159 RepID=A0A6N6VUS3_9BACT|nr:hypothetical protein [Silvanigrella paludirubra]KAB8039943.1 hypothetical protein GCL60_06690 [Silvanigrella paludirubra]